MPQQDDSAREGSAAGTSTTEQNDDAIFRIDIDESQSPLPSNHQIGLKGIFICMTLVAAIIAAFRFAHPLIGGLLCTSIVVLSVLRIAPREYAATGGLQAFMTSLVCLPVMLMLVQDVATQVILCLAMPTFAFLSGQSTPN